MLLPLADTNKLSSESRTRIELFYQRFCEGSLRRQYGLGHLVYACHAAFPLVLSPDLVNLIYINFNHFHYKDGSADNIHPIAVSDFLLSPLCRQISNKQYEVFPEIRSYLLHLLKDGTWLYRYGIQIKGEERLNELADFLQQYIKVKRLEGSYDGTGFRQLNEWAALAYQNPGELARRIAGMLEKHSKDDQGQLWLNKQMERIEKQFNFDIHNHGSSKEVLTPFFNLYYYSQARKGELFHKEEADIYSNAAKISVDSVALSGSGTTIQLPLSKNIAERTERKINKVQRIVSLLIGIDEYATIPSLKGCVYGARQMEAMLEQLQNEKDFDKGFTLTLLNADATKQNILDGLKSVFEMAHPEDICLIYFAGHGENDSYDENYLITADYEQGTNPGLSNVEFYHALQAAKVTKPCKTVFILDSHSGYYQWVDEDDVFLGAVRHTKLSEQTFGTNTASAFLISLIEIINQTKGKISYKHLLLWLRFKVRYEYKMQDEVPVILTAPSNLDQYFLHNQFKHADHTPAIVYNKYTGNWQVLEEDFKLIQLNTGATLKDYVTNEPIDTAKGEVFVRDNELLFGGLTQQLNPTALYKVIVGRPLLPVYINDEQESAGTIDRIHNQLERVRFDVFSKWNGLECFRSSELQHYDHEERLLVEDHGGSYTVSFGSSDYQHNKASVTGFTVGELSLLSEFPDKFVRYHYCCNLALPGENYKEYRALSVRLRHRWQNETNDRFAYSSGHLELNRQSFYIREGRIVFNPLQLEIANDEEFPVFYQVYIVMSDLTIKRMQPESTAGLTPFATETLTVQEPLLFEAILSRQLSAQIKLLVSRDPIPFDFSQTGFSNV